MHDSMSKNSNGLQDEHAHVNMTPERKFKHSASKDIERSKVITNNGLDSSDAGHTANGSHNFSGNGGTSGGSEHSSPSRRARRRSKNKKKHSGHGDHSEATILDNANLNDSFEGDYAGGSRELSSMLDIMMLTATPIGATDGDNANEQWTWRSVLHDSLEFKPSTGTGTAAPKHHTEELVHERSEDVVQLATADSYDTGYSVPVCSRINRTHMLEHAGALPVDGSGSSATFRSPTKPSHYLGLLQNL